MKKRIIDKRKKEKFMMDDVYLNGQARICGWQATLVYVSLCRHASKDQESFPSIKLMANELAVSPETIRKGVENLQKYNVIKVERKKTKFGDWASNTYILLDKSEWKEIGVLADTNHGTGSQPVGVLADVGTKETHKQGNTYKETHISSDVDFDTFWKAYPKHVGKKEAKRRFLKLNKALLQVMLQAIDKQKQTDQWRKNNGQFVPNPATWLNQERWEDEVPEKTLDEIAQDMIRECVEKYGYDQGHNTAFFRFMNKYFPDNDQGINRFIGKVFDI